jgi:transcriptional regulator with XRE-family HTH domain
MLTPAQLRAARALLGWSRQDLANKSGTAAETVQGFESRGSDPKLSTLNKWHRALELAGVVFIDPNPMGGDELGPGVRLTGREGEAVGAEADGPRP